MATGSFERKSFTGGAAPTTLGANLGVGDTSISVADGSTYPTGATNPFVIVINRGTTTEEKVLIASRSGNVLTVDTRGYDDGTDQDHTLGETVEHVLDASTVDQANRYVNLQSAKGDLVAHDGTNPNAVNVGTNGDVLAADSTATNGVAWTNRLTTAESEIDTLQSDVTTLQGTDIDVELTGDVTGTATSTNLGNVSIATTLANNSVDSDQIVDGSIDTVHIGDDQVTGDKIAHNTISATHINANAVGSSELANDAVDTNAIADNSVSYAKLLTDLQNRFPRGELTSIVVTVPSSDTGDKSRSSYTVTHPGGGDRMIMFWIAIDDQSQWAFKTSGGTTVIKTDISQYGNSTLAGYIRMYPLSAQTTFEFWNINTGGFGSTGRAAIYDFGLYSP